MGVSTRIQKIYQWPTSTPKMILPSPATITVNSSTVISGFSKIHSPIYAGIFPGLFALVRVLCTNQCICGLINAMTMSCSKEVTPRYFSPDSILYFYLLSLSV